MHDRDDQSADWIRNLDESMAIYDSDHRAYYNYVDLDVGKEYGKVYWRDNYPRLRQIKSKYDPLNAFHHETSIKPL
jgi:FAD/FMN-containing dehydrogenase